MRSPTAPSSRTRRSLAACAPRAQSPQGPPAPDGARLRRRRPLGLGAHRGAASSSPPARASRTSSCTPSPTAATRCRSPAAGYIAELERWLRHAGRVGTVERPLLRDGPRHAAGSARSSPTTRSSTPRAPRATTPRRRSTSAHEAGETDEFIKPTVIGDYDGMAPRATSRSTSTSARTGRGSWSGRSPSPDFDEFAAVRRARVRADDAHRSTGRAGRIRSPSRRRARDDPRRGPRRGAARASSTSPRPRSTPTSPTSSTAGARRSGRGRSAAWSTRRATSPPTTTSRR